MLQTPLLLVPALLLAPPKYDYEKLPYRTAWGPYQVVVEAVKNEDEEQQRLRILDAEGPVLREVRDTRLLDVSFVELTGRGAPELHVSGFSGGAHCCSTEASLR